MLLEVAHPGFEEAREALAWPDFSYRIDQDPAIAAEGTTGSYIGIDGETLGLGLNVFGNDCVVAGSAFFATGETAGEATPGGAE